MFVFATLARAVDWRLHRFIHQTKSWSPLQVSLDMYHMLCERLEVLPQFLDVLSGFGVKTSEVDEESPVSFQRFHCLQDDATKLQRCGECRTKFKVPCWISEEITYNFYHVEQHGRSNLKDPWSIRQTAVYQRFSFSDERSTWIIIQLAKPIRTIIEKVIAGERPRSSTNCGHWLQPIVIHSMILTISQRRWKYYIRYLAERLSSLVSPTFTLSRAFPSHRSF